jgi:hypothetical protein
VKEGVYILYATGEVPGPGNVKVPGGKVLEEFASSFWTWKRLRMIVIHVQDGRTLTPGEWHAIQRGIPYLSPAKRTWLYRQLRPYFTPQGLRYLFQGWRPSPSLTGLDTWIS